VKCWSECEGAVGASVEVTIEQHSSALPHADLDKTDRSHLPHDNQKRPRPRRQNSIDQTFIATVSSIACSRRSSLIFFPARQAARTSSTLAKMSMTTPQADPPQAQASALENKLQFDSSTTASQSSSSLTLQNGDVSPANMSAPAPRSAHVPASAVTTARDEEHSFIRVRRLPCELRLQVWKFSMQPWAVYIGPDPDDDFQLKIICQDRIPGVLHANRESRQISLNCYQFIEEYNGVYLNPSMDVLVLRCAEMWGENSWMVIGMEEVLEALVLKRGLAGLEHLVLDELPPTDY